MAIIHFLNVKDGDCSIIKHNSDRVTVIDVCNAKIPEPENEIVSSLNALSSKLDTLLEHIEYSSKGNFQQKKHPVNPISYMKDHGINNIFRYIQTHPDMDHMDGIKALFETFDPMNFWDTDNIKNISNSSWDGYLILKKTGNSTNISEIHIRSMIPDGLLCYPERVGRTTTLGQIAWIVMETVYISLPQHRSWWRQQTRWIMNTMIAPTCSCMLWAKTESCSLVTPTITHGSIFLRNAEKTSQISTY